MIDVEPQWLALVALGGALGAIARVVLYEWVDRLAGGRIEDPESGPLPSPAGTLVVNALGSFLIGIVVVQFEGAASEPAMRAFWAAGLCGALTTFSTFCADGISLLSRGRAGGPFLLYCAAHATITVGAVALGRACAG